MIIKDVVTAMDYYLSVRALPEHLHDYHQRILESSMAHLPLYSDHTEQLNGLGILAFTTAIMVDLNEQSYSARLCFDNYEDALIAHTNWHQHGFDMNHLPSGWVACRGITKKSIINTFPKDYCLDVFEVAKNLNNGQLKLFSEIDMLRFTIAEILNCSVEHVRHAGAYFKEIGKII